MLEAGGFVDPVGGGVVGPSFLPYLFINFAGFVDNHLVEIYAYFSFAVVALLLIGWLLSNTTLVQLRDAGIAAAAGLVIYAVSTSRNRGRR